MSQWLHRCTAVRVLCGKRHRAGSNLGFFLFFFFLSVNVLKCDEGYVLFLHIVAKSPSDEPMLDAANRRY